MMVMMMVMIDEDEDDDDDDDDSPAWDTPKSRGKNGKNQGFLPWIHR
jgi:hypothetical protein